MKTCCTILLSLLLGTGFLFAQATETTQMKTAAGPGTYKILRKTDGPIRIPFRMHKGKPLMELTINDEPATLMIDNGILWDEVWLFGSPLVKKLGLKPVDQATIGGAGEGDPTAAYTSTNLKLGFKDIVFYEQPSFVSPPASGFAKIFPGADGQLCNTFFKHFVVEFDFINNEVILHDPETFTYTGNGAILELKLNKSGTHAVPFAFVLNNGKAYSGWTDIDFGGIRNFKIALNNGMHIPLPADVQPTASRGAQGKQQEYRGEIRSFTIGDYVFDHPEVHFGDEGTSRIHPENLGVIGLPLFLKFDTIFDYIHYRIYLTPNENAYKEPGFHPVSPAS